MSKTQKYHESLKAYPKALIKHLWVVIVSVILGVAGALQSVFQLLIPDWLWMALIIGGIFVAQFLAWHKLRLDRDRLKQFNVNQDVLEQLAEYRAQLISHQNERIDNETELGKWIEKFTSLKKGSYFCFYKI